MITLKNKCKFNKIYMKLFVCCTFLLLVSNLINMSLAKGEQNINYEIIESQKESLDVQGFVKEANKYTEDVFSNTDIGELLNSAITGKINNKKIFISIWNLFGNEFISCITGIATIIVIIVIHSIIKSISDGLENKSISRNYILCRIYISCRYNNK